MECFPLQIDGSFDSAPRFSPASGKDSRPFVQFITIQVLIPSNEVNRVGELIPI